MIIKEIITALETTATERPVVKIIHQNESCKVMALGFNKGMVLGNHHTEVPATLIVLDGSVIYEESGRKHTLNKFDELKIPVLVVHAVTALENSVCILIRG